MTTQNRYILVRARKNQDGSPAVEARITFPSWMSDTLVCAGITSRFIELSDGNIVERGDVPDANNVEDAYRQGMQKFRDEATARMAAARSEAYDHGFNAATTAAKTLIEEAREQGRAEGVIAGRETRVSELADEVAPALPPTETGPNDALYEEYMKSRDYIGQLEARVEELIERNTTLEGRAAKAHQALKGVI